MGKVTCPICDNKIEITDNEIKHVCPVCEMDIFIDLKHIIALQEKEKQNTFQLEQEKVDAITSKDSQETDTINDDFDAMINLINVYYKNSEHEKARETAKHLTEVFPDNPIAWYHLAVCEMNIANTSDLSTMPNSRIKEILNNLDKAIELLKNDKDKQLEIKSQQQDFASDALMVKKFNEIEKLVEYKNKVKDHKFNTQNKSKHLSKASIYEKPTPKPFFHNTLSKCIFIFLIVATALSIYGCFQAKSEEKVVLFYGSICMLAIILVWVIRYFIKNYKKIDTTEPKVLKRIRKIIQIAFIIVSAYTLYTGIIILLYEYSPEILNELLTNINIPYEYIKLKVLLFISTALLLVLMLIFSINQIRIENYLRESKNKSKNNVTDTSTVNLKTLPTSKKHQAELIKNCDRDIEKLNQEIDNFSKLNPTIIVKMLKEKVKKA